AHEGNGAGRLIQASDGNLYGTCCWSASSAYGAVFKLTLAGAFSVLHSFSADRFSPLADLLQATDGNFYGTGGEGIGATGELFAGTVFRVTPATGELTVLHRFVFPYDGILPHSLLQGRDGNFY